MRQGAIYKPDLLVEPRQTDMVMDGCKALVAKHGTS